MEYIIVILLIYLIFRDIVRDDISKLFRKKETDEIEEQKQKAYKKEFDNMMRYSIEDAIASKRSEIDG